MTVHDLIDQLVSGRICLTLLHSLWQVALLAMAARVIERWRRKPSAQWSYALHVAVLCANLAAVPLTYALLDGSDNGMAPIRHTAVAGNHGVKAAQAASGHAPNPADQVAAVRSVSPPTVVTTSDRTLTWRQAAPWIIAVYLLGVALMLSRLLAALVYAQRLANGAKPITAGPLLATIQALARRWSMRIAPVLAETERVVAPRVVGLIRPVILLPASAVSGLSCDELELILGHELAHIHRHDMWIVLVQRVAEAALFYNPALWYLSRRISALREYCCDDAACRAHWQADGPLRYAATLVKLIELTAPELAARANPLALAAQGRSPSELRRRVARLLGEPLREPLRLTRGAALTAAVSLVLLAFLPAMTRSEPQPSGNSDAAKQKGKSDAAAKNRFSFGGKVEILALGTHGQNEDRWWDGHGKPLPPLPTP
ncbi:MAG: M56 family metallopeptidase, partial [Pirellulales bacterium]